jgi:uncharacterized membrane protein
MDKQKLKKRIMRFVDAIILLCLVMCVIITLSNLWEYHRLNVVMGAGEMTALLAVWGGELLLIVVRQVLGSDVTKKSKEEKEDSDE